MMQPNWVTIADETKQEIEKHIMGLIKDSDRNRQIAVKLRQIFADQFDLNKNKGVYFKIIYKNVVYEDEVYTGNNRSICVNLHPTLIPKMEDYIKEKEEAEKGLNKVKTLLRKVFLVAKNLGDVSALLPYELRKNISFASNNPPTLTEEQVAEFNQDNMHILKSVNEVLFLNTLLGKL